MRVIDMTKKGNISESEITVTELDYLRLRGLIQKLYGNNSVDVKYLKFLDLELQKALRVDSKLITPDFITMNSVTEITFLDTNKTIELRLVYPHNANYAKGLISVLSPLGCALLGYKAGDVVAFKAPKGEQKVRIEKVIYQPEAHGEDLI